MPALLIIFAAFALRLFWISDMEFKGDELGTLQYMTDLISKADYSPLSPIAENSGFSHSSGFFYFLKWISFGSKDPIWIATSIAVANALGIAIALWLNRQSKKSLVLFAMCATSLNLVLGSRKIWTPDLVPFWIYLFIGLFLFTFSSDAAENFKKTPPSFIKKFTLSLSAICLILSGHMYIPGVCFALIGTVSVFTWLMWRRLSSLLLPWSIGSILGWLTWFPYLISLWKQSSTAIKSNSHIAQSITSSFHFIGFWHQLRYMLALPSPYGSLRLYLLKSLPEIQQTTSSPFLLNLTLIVLIGTCVFWTLGFFLSWIQVIRLRNKALKDGMLFVSISILFGTILALQIVKMGVHLHYWLGAIPFAYYIMAWAYENFSPILFSKFHIRKLAWLGMGGAIASVLLFFILVRQSGGLEGEYKKSYRTQMRMDP